MRAGRGEQSGRVGPEGSAGRPPGGEGIVVGFVAAVRAAGLPVPTGATVTFGRALAAVGLDRPERVYWAGRATLVQRPEDVPAYDRAFAAYFSGRPVEAEGSLVQTVEVGLDVPDDGADDPGADDGGPAGTDMALRWSPTEVLRHKDLAACTPEEREEAHRLMAGLRVQAALRKSRRRRPDPRGRGRLDPRRSVRRALRDGGELFRPAATRRGERPRRLVVLVDVSGSMEPYSRALVRWAHAAVAARRRGRVEAFALGTRVTRITPALTSHDPDQALRRAADTVADWSGGTRLGDGLRRFNDEWGVRGAARGAVVVILSDGWDRGDPEVLGAEMARLGRVAHRVVWVNPLKASPAYAPLARGMAAALPHVDEFVEGHSVASLEALAAVVGR